jgi:hypothetical protein
MVPLVTIGAIGCINGDPEHHNLHRHLMTTIDGNPMAPLVPLSSLDRRWIIIVAIFVMVTIDTKGSIGAIMTI